MERGGTLEGLDWGKREEEKSELLRKKLKNEAFLIEKGRKNRTHSDTERDTTSVGTEGRQGGEETDTSPLGC